MKFRCSVAVGYEACLQYSEPTEVSVVKTGSWRLFNTEVICALALLVTVAGIFYFSRDYPTMPGQFSGSPAFWPRAVALVLAVLAVIMFISGLVSPTKVTWPDRAGCVKLVAVVAVLYGSRWSLEWLGFVPSMTLLMLICMLVLTGKEQLSLKATLGMAGVALGVSYFLFFVLAYLARIPLPRGTWF